MLPVEKLKYLRSIRQVPQRRQFSPVHLSVQLLIYSPCCCAALFSRCSQFVVAKFTPPNCLIPYSSATAAPIILSIPTPFIRWSYAAFLSIFIADFHFFSAVDGIYHSTPYNSLRRPKLFYIAHNMRSFFFLFFTRFITFLRSILFQSTNSPPNSALGGNLYAALFGPSYSTLVAFFLIVLYTNYSARGISISNLGSKFVND